MAFTFFALFAALFCLLVSAIILVVQGRQLDKYIKYLLIGMYFIFGPMMLVACSMGFINFDRVYYVCIGDDPNTLMSSYPNLFVLLVLGSLSFSITISYSLSQLATWINNMLGNDDSWLSRIVARYWQWRIHRVIRGAIDRRRQQILSSRTLEEEQILLKDDQNE